MIPSGKRRQEHQLTKDDAEDDNAQQAPKGYRKAVPEIIASRAQIKAQSRLSNMPAPKGINPFAMFTSPQSSPSKQKQSFQSIISPPKRSTEPSPPKVQPPAFKMPAPPASFIFAGKEVKAPTKTSSTQSSTFKAPNGLPTPPSSFMFAGQTIPASAPASTPITKPPTPPTSFLFAGKTFSASAPTLVEDKMQVDAETNSTQQDAFYPTLIALNKSFGSAIQTAFDKEPALDLLPFFDAYKLKRQRLVFAHLGLRLSESPVGDKSQASASAPSAFTGFKPFVPPTEKSEATTTPTAFTAFKPPTFSVDDKPKTTTSAPVAFTGFQPFVPPKDNKEKATTGAPIAFPTTFPAFKPPTDDKRTATTGAPIAFPTTFPAFKPPTFSVADTPQANSSAPSTFTGFKAFTPPTSEKPSTSNGSPSPSSGRKRSAPVDDDDVTQTTTSPPSKKADLKPFTPSTNETITKAWATEPKPDEAPSSSAATTASSSPVIANPFASLAKETAMPPSPFTGFKPSAPVENKPQAATSAPSAFTGFKSFMPPTNDKAKDSTSAPTAFPTTFPAFKPPTLSVEDKSQATTNAPSTFTGFKPFTPPTSETATKAAVEPKPEEAPSFSAASTVSGSPVIANPFASLAKDAAQPTVTPGTFDHSKKVVFGSTSPSNKSGVGYSFGLSPSTKPEQQEAKPQSAFSFGSAPTFGVQPSTTPSPFSFASKPSDSATATPASSAFSFAPKSSSDTAAAVPASSAFSFAPKTSNDASLSATAPAFSFGAKSTFGSSELSKASPFSFGGPPATTTSEPATQASTADQDKEDDKADNGETAETTETKEPESNEELIRRGEGEEDEDTLHEVRARVFRHNKVDKKWDDLGITYFKVNKHQKTDVRRMLARNVGNGKLVLNMRLFKEMQPKAERTMVAFNGIDDDGKLRVYRLKTRNVELANQLAAAINEWIP